MPKNNALETSAEDRLRAQTDELADPFALDIFASSTIEPAILEDEDDAGATETNAEPSTVDEFGRDWHLTLPRASAADVYSNNVLTKISSDLAANLLEIAASGLSECVANNQVSVVCTRISTEENDLKSKAAEFAREETVFFEFAIEPQRARGALALDAAFAVKAIKKSFAYEADTEEKRNLSENELAVAEFFALNCLSRINKWFAEPLFRLQNAAQKPPEWLQNQPDGDAGDNAEKPLRGLFCKIKVALDDEATIAALFLPFDLLESLSATNNPLLTARERGSRDLSKIISSVRVRVNLGETDLSSGDLTAISAGDVVLIERPAIEFADFSINGGVEARIGSERTASFYGNLSTDETLKFALYEVNQSNETGGAIRLKMQDEQPEESNGFDSNNEEAGEAASLALEKIAITLRAEIASRRITLDELANLRLNQIIELGARPTDPIELVADGKTVAIGELVNIEDNLGVRLTKILL